MRRMFLPRRLALVEERKQGLGLFSWGLFLNQDKAGLRSGELFCPAEKACDEEFFILMPVLLLGQTISTGQDEFSPGGVARSERRIFIPTTFCLVYLCRMISTAKTLHSSLRSRSSSLGGTVRLGFNPGELLDFILGWTTIDIYGDDIEARKQKEKSNQSSEATPKPGAPQ